MVDIGEKTAPNDAKRTMPFFCGTVKTEYATLEATGCSLMGSALGTVSGVCSDGGT